MVRGYHSKVKTSYLSNFEDVEPDSIDEIFDQRGSSQKLPTCEFVDLSKLQNKSRDSTWGDVSVSNQD
jgi:hypothetical protein